MKIHNIKLNEEFADAVLSGEKNFEIRNNDRGYQKGDIIKFRVIDEWKCYISHPLNEVTFKITFVLSGWGIKEGYVVFGIKRRKQRRGRKWQDI